MSILLFSPVRCEPDVLSLTLPQWKQQGCDELWVLDDNGNEASSNLLRADCDLVKLHIHRPRSNYHLHSWTKGLANRLGAIKDRVIEQFLKTKHQYLFLVDADLLLVPGTVPHLLDSSILADDAVICSVFWTKWSPDDWWKPNVWDWHHYGFDEAASILRWKAPTVAEVGGLGACTLIPRGILEDGARFRPIKGLQGWEDRHFCISVTSREGKLAASSYLPPFHIYRPEMLQAAAAWQADGYRREWFNERWLDEGWERQGRGSFG